MFLIILLGLTFQPLLSSDNLTQSIIMRGDELPHVPAETDVKTSLIIAKDRVAQASDALKSLEKSLEIQKSPQESPKRFKRKQEQNKNIKRVELKENPQNKSIEKQTEEDPWANREMVIDD